MTEKTEKYDAPYLADDIEYIIVEEDTESHKQIAKITDTLNPMSGYVVRVKFKEG